MMYQRHQRLDATAVTPGRTLPPGLLVCYRYLVHSHMLCLPGGFWCSPDLNTALPAADNRCANRILENLHRSAATLDLLAPVAPMANVPQQLLAALLFFHFSSVSLSLSFKKKKQKKLPLARSCFSAVGSYHNRNHSSRGSASSSGLACCHNSPCEPRTDR